MNTVEKLVAQLADLGCVVVAIPVSQLGDIDNAEKKAYIEHAMRNAAIELINEFNKSAEKKVSEKIREQYDDGCCPDCGEEIPYNVSDEQSCTNCGHVFTLPRSID